MTTRPEQLAEAMLHIATVNHYMVGLTADITLSELSEAQQILIRKQNDLVLSDPNHKTYDLALDLVEAKWKEMVR